MKVYISATLRNFFGRNRVIDATGNTIRDILRFLTDEYPEAKEILYDGSGKLRSFIRIYVGNDNRTEQDKWYKELKEEDEVLLLPAIAGGAPQESIISDERRKEESFDDAEIERFGKHLLLREIGVKG